MFKIGFLRSYLFFAVRVNSGRWADGTHCGKTYWNLIKQMSSPLLLKFMQSLKEILQYWPQ